jgi:hypothetical protein
MGATVTAAVTTAPMTQDEAERISQRIALRLDTIADNTEAVCELIEKASQGEAWRALGYESWPAYVVGRFGDALARVRRAERLPLTQALAETGMSTRAIASLTGVSQPTVVRDLGEQVIHDESPAGSITGLDGKAYPRPDPGPPPTRKPRRRRPLIDQWRDNQGDLRRVVEKYERHVADDRFKAKRRDLASHAHELAQLTWRLVIVHERTEVGADPNGWALWIERTTAEIPYAAFTDDQLADALGAAEALRHLLKGESVTRKKIAAGGGSS